MTRSILFLIPLLIVSCAAQQAEPLVQSKDSQQSATVAHQEASPEESQDRLVCRKEKKTGSHRPTKICRTVKRINDDQIKAATTMDKIRRH